MDTIERIERTLDTLRPYIASHRGQVEVIDFDEQDGRLLLRLGGTCHGCRGLCMWWGWCSSRSRASCWAA